MNKEEDMSNTFVAEVGQKSAVFKKSEEVESLEESKENSFPEVKIDPPTEMPAILEKDQNTESQNEEKPEIDEDEEFLEAKKKKKSKKYKKRNPFVTFLIIVICLALGAGASYYYFEVYTNDTKKEKSVNTKNEVTDKTTNESEEISPNSLFINELISNYDYSAITNVEVYSILYAQDKVYIKDLDETYLRTLAAKKANKSLYGVSFSSEQFQNAVKILYGNTISLPDKEFSIDNGCITMNYNNSYYAATPGACGGISMYSMERKVVKATKKEDTLEVNVAVAILLGDVNKVYKGFNSANSDNPGIDEVTGVTADTFDISKDYTKLNQYKYTFKFDEENYNYYLESIELMK